MGVVVLENEVLRAEFDGRTGALVGLLSKATGWAVEGHSGWAYFLLPAHVAQFNMRRLDWNCMHHPEWRRVCRDEFARSLDLDPDGVLIDESCNARADGRYCFAAEHGHPVPAFNPQGDNRLMEELNAVAARCDRPQVIVGEATHDLQTAEYGMRI